MGKQLTKPTITLDNDVDEALKAVSNITGISKRRITELALRQYISEKYIEIVDSELKSKDNEDLREFVSKTVDFISKGIL